MKGKRLLILGAALSLTVAVGVGVGFGVVASKEAVPVYAAASYAFTGNKVTFANQGLANDTQYTDPFTNASDINTFQVQFGSGANDGKYYTTGTGIRTYGGGHVTVTALNGGSLTNVVFTWSGSSYAAGTDNISGYTLSSTTGTWTGYASSISLERASGSGHWRLQSVQATVQEATTDPSVTISSAPRYLVDGGSAGTLTATIANDDSYTVTWSANPSTGVTFSPATSTSGDDVNVSFDGVTTGTTPIVITATIDDGNDTASDPKNIYALGHAGTSSDPFTATDAMVFSHTDYAAQSGGDWYVEGYVVGTYNTDRGYYVDEDSTATSSPYKFEVYNSSGVTNSTGKEIIVGTSYIVAHGSMTYYTNGSQCEMTGSVITSVDNGSIPSIVIDGGDRTVDLNDSITLTVTKEYDEGATVTWSSSDTTVATVSSDGVVTLLKVGTTDITASMIVKSVTYSSTITLTVEKCPVQIGKTYIISSVFSGTTYYLSGVSNSLGTCSTSQNEAMILTIEAGNTSGSFAFKNGNNYLKAKNGNNLETETELSDNSSWFVSNDGTKDLMRNVGQSTRLLSYNDNGHASDSSKVNRFAAYNSQQSSSIIITEVTAPEVEGVTIMGDSTADADGALFVTSTFLYEVAYTDPSNPGNQSVTISVLPDSGVTTTSPSDGSFDVKFTENGTYTVTVTSDEDSNFSDSTTIVVSNIYVAVSVDYELYEGTTVSGNAVLTEGDYVIYYSGKALKNSISSNRATYSEAEPVGDVISTSAMDIVWHIGLDGEYYTIYNELEGKYLASTNSNNQAKFESSITDNSRWTVEISEGQFEFINKARADASSNNKYLRENGTYGFACYASGTGGALSLYRKSADDYLKSATRIATIRGTSIIENEQVTGFSNLDVRFGIKISKADWNAVLGVEDYGVMMFLASASKVNSAPEVSSRYDENAGLDGQTLLSVGRRESNSAPDEDGNGNYNFTVKVNIPSSSWYDYYFCARPFVKINGEIHWLLEQDIKVSVRTMADGDNDGTNLLTNELDYLKTAH